MVKIGRLMVSLSLVVVLSCSDSSLIGDHFLGETGIEVSINDSLTLNFYTVRTDSLVTSANQRFLVGNYEHSELGRLMASSYFLPSIAESDIPSIDNENYRFDSATLILMHDGYSYYDDQIIFTLNVHQLSDDLETNDNGYLYNTSVQPGDEGKLLLGQKRIKADLFEREEVEISLDGSFGQTLFDKIANQDEEIYSDLEFQQFFHGFKISATDAESPFFGFYADSTVLRVYYTDVTSFPITQGHADFNVTQRATYYTSFTQTDVPAELSDLADSDDKVASEATGGASCVQGGAGYAVRLEIPYARTLLLDGMDYLISYAELRLYPVHSFEYENTPLPAYLDATIVDSNNDAVTDAIPALELVEDFELGRDTYYAMDVSDLMTFLLTPYTNTQDNALLITLDTEEMGKSVQNVILGDTDFESKLILYTISNNE